MTGSKRPVDDGGGRQPDMTGRPSDRAVDVEPRVPIKTVHRAGTAGPKRKKKRKVAARKNGIGRWIGLGVLSITLLCVAAGGLLYVRLLYGGISLASLTPRIEQALTDDLDGHSARIDSAELRLDGRNLVLGLSQISLITGTGQTIAQAPEARGIVSLSALRRGRLALSKVELVSPRLNVSVNPDGAVSLSFASTTQGASTAAAPPQRHGSDEAANSNFDIIKILTDASARARRRETASGFLREIALAQTVIVIANGTQRSVWNVPEVRIDLSHRRGRSAIAGRATVATLSGPLIVTANTNEADSADHLTLDIGIEGFNPRGLARLIPGLGVMESIDLPLTGKAQVQLSTDGRILSAVAEAGANSGEARVGLLGRKAVPLDATHVKLTYDGARRAFHVGEAMFGWGGSRLTLTGEIVAEAGAGSGWTYALRSTGGMLASPKAARRGARIEQARASGRWSTTEGRFTLGDLAIRAAGAELTGKGDVLWTGGVPAGEINGRLSPMSADVLIALWPSVLAPGVRDWVSTHVTKGQVAGGLFKTAIEAHRGEATARLSLTVEASGVEVQTVKGMPPLEIARGLLRVEGQTIEITSPEVIMTAAENRKLQMRAARFTAVETADGDQPTAEVAFRLQAPLPALADLADRAPLQLLKSNGFAAPAGLDGRIEGAFKATFPLADNVQMTEVRSEGRLRVTDLKARQVFGANDLSGGTINVEIGDKVVDVRGDLQVKSVNAKFGWQYLVNQPLAQQPPLRVAVTLDNAERNALGLDVADLVQGETPVEVLVAFAEGGQTNPRVRIDLTKAELTFEPIAWRKAPGRPATFQFDAVKGPGTGTAQRLELQQMKLQGDDIALEGWMAIGPDNKPREFSFSEFNLNVVSRLAVHGKRRPDNIWDIHAKGPTFDGRDLFRAMFNVGGQPALAVRKEKPGQDIHAEIDTVIGFSDTTLKGVKLRIGHRSEKLTDLDVKATLATGKPFAAQVRNLQNVGRQLQVHAGDAGQAFKLVGFYPSAVGGELKLEVNLDAKGVNEKTGMLWAENFAVLGDSIVGDLYQNAESQPSAGQGPAQPKRSGQPRVQQRQQFDFEVLRIPFEVGLGQFVTNGAVLRGPLIGATFRGKIDFKQQQVNLGGTYVPLSGLNQALGSILGPLTGGAQGEGLFGITFQVLGPLANPQVIANPFSLLTPGIFREIMQLTPETFRVTPRAEQPAATSRARQKAPDPARSPTPAADVRPAAAEPAPRPPGEVLPDWSSSVKPTPTRPKAPESAPR